MGCIQCHFSGEKLQNLGMLTILSQCFRFSGSTYAEFLNTPYRVSCYIKLYRYLVYVNMRDNYMPWEPLSK